MEGREAGTPGFDRAADYIKNRFETLGLLPAGDNGSYFQDVPMVEFERETDFGGTIEFLGDDAPTGIIPGDDYIISASATNKTGTIEAPVVFAGFGLVAPDHDRDDYGNLDVAGKIVMVVRGAPKFLNSEERAHYRSTQAKRASDRGAIGIISIPTPTSAKRFPWARLLKVVVGNTGMRWLTNDGTPHSTSPKIESSAFFNIATAEKIFAGLPTSWEEIAASAESNDGKVPSFDTGFAARLTYQSKQRNLTSTNVIGLLPGADPQLRDEFIVVTGHLDHIGIKPTDDPDDDEIYNGAMDNATGIASILETARLLKDNPPKRSILFVALTAEEKGLVGSDYLAQNPVVGADQVVANINMDMPIINYDFEDVVAFGGERTTMFPVVTAAADRANLKLSPDPFPDEGFFTRSDQYSFVKQGIPSLYLDIGVAGGGGPIQEAFLKTHYHEPSDEADLVNYDSLQRFAQVNAEIVQGVANMDKRPRWKTGDFFGLTFGGIMEKDE